MALTGPVTLAVPPRSPLPGTNTLLLGGSGAGKTSALRTLTGRGIEIFGLFTEPGFEVVGDLPDEKLHWHYIPPATTDWSAAIDTARKINTFTFQQLTNLADINKTKYNQYVQLLESLSNFKCDRCGKAFGAVDSWGTGRGLWLDSLSGLNVMAMTLVVGTKPVKSMSDWGVAMDNLEGLIRNLCVLTRCHFVLVGHIERENSEMSGSQIMAATLGRKLAPKLPIYFSDVVLAQRNASAFSWSTAAVGVDLKARNLRIGDNLQPSFGQILDSWISRGGIIEVPPSL